MSAVAFENHTMTTITRGCWPTPTPRGGTHPYAAAGARCGHHRLLTCNTVSCWMFVPATMSACVSWFAARPSRGVTHAVRCVGGRTHHPAMIEWLEVVADPESSSTSDGPDARQVRAWVRSYGTKVRWSDNTLTSMVARQNVTVDDDCVFAGSLL